MRSSSTLPPLQSLRAFAAVAQLLSFRRAGEELLITQSAVSHHIRELEQNVGVKLFIRKARGVELTPEGQQYFEIVRRAFDLIASGTSDLRRCATKPRVRVSLLPSFAANWLVPRLRRFNESHPHIELVLDPTLRLTNFAGGEADLAIRYGDGRWNEVESQLLMTESLTPVASPKLLREGPRLSEPRDVLNHPLLLALKPYEWEIWAEANRVDLRTARTIQLSDYNVVLQAALDGQGIAVGRLSLAADRLRSGALMQLFDKVVTSPRAGYWLVTPRHSRPTEATAAFMTWIADEATASQHDKTIKHLPSGPPQSRHKAKSGSNRDKAGRSGQPQRSRS
jgi:LysR family transcriptional regulator, glycine cleavage system transcriptional activator